MAEAPRRIVMTILPRPTEINAALLLRGHRVEIVVSHENHAPAVA
jgi:hypothetical protein